MGPVLFLTIFALACGEDSGQDSEPDAAMSAVDQGRPDGSAVGTMDGGTTDAGQTTVDGSITSDSSTVDGSSLGDASPTPAGDRTDEVYERSRLLDVRIEIARADWDALRVQRRTGVEIVAPECLLPPSPYTWFSARVTINGEVFENVGIRKKGFFGSLSEAKPSVKLRFDKFVEDQTYLDVKRLTLNNAQQDASYVRQCLAYDLFRQGGGPAPRCNFAHVHINGTDMGVYTNIESIKKPFLRRHFDDEDGYLYEGTLSDFRENWTGTIDQKTNEDQPSTRIIDAISTALEAPDDQLLEALSGPLDLDAFITFWATEILVAHWDGYSGNTNNFYFYENPDTGKAHFIPWGTDGTFIPPLLFFEGRSPAPRSVNAAGLIARRLYLHPEGRQRYLDRLQSLLDTVWDVPALEASVEQMVQVFGGAVPAGGLRRVWAGIDDTLTFINEQGDLIRGEIERGPIQWEVPLRGSLCAQQNGESQGSFSTTWGSWPTEDTFQTGMGMVSININDQPVAIEDVGGAIGLEEGAPGRGQLIVPMVAPGVGLLFYNFTFPAADVVDGAVKNVADEDTSCGLFTFDTRTRRVGQFASCFTGTLTFEQGSTEQGAPVSGRFQVDLWARRR